MERVLKKARIANPIGSKIDHRYYERVRAEYKAQRDSIFILDRWVVNGIPSKEFSERTTGENQ